MNNREYKTFFTLTDNGIMTVTFDYKPINVLGLLMMNDLSRLCDKLENDKSIKTVIFNSSVEDFFIAHADIDYLQYLPTTPVLTKDIKINDLALVLNRVSKLPQATIAVIDGYARGGGHEFALACDMRFATPKSVFMQMEVGMGILPCGGGCARMARLCGLGNALEIILSARDFNANEAYQMGTINRVIESDEIGLYAFNLARRISCFPSESITACKNAVIASLNMSIEDALKVETYELYQATSQTPAVKRFKYAAEVDFQDNLYNQKNFETLLIGLQNIK